ncbi:MAG: inositol monophosphatase [Halobacteriovoraceae bacterium]|nr:inositol monophosphatase [Halobacteriovoraceae bacterium]
MDLTIDQLKELTKLAKKAALEAGKVISAAQGKNISTQSKQGGENIASQVVTEIDLKAEDAILSVLEPTLKKYNIGLLAEEGSAENTCRFEKNYFWCIDPLDGTLCFSRNEDGYSTSIALVSKSGIPTIGVVYNPRSQTLYHAIKNQGAYKNDSPLTVNDGSKVLTLLFDQSYTKHPLFEEQVDTLKQNLKKVGLKELKLHHLGGAVMNGISTIDLAPALYYKFPKKNLGGGSLWDFAASSVIQSEAGGLNSDYHNQPLDLNRPDSTFMNHKGIIYASSAKLLDLIPKMN